jgi:hypothetical protein
MIERKIPLPEPNSIRTVRQQRTSRTTPGETNLSEAKAAWSTSIHRICVGTEPRPATDLKKFTRPT